MTDKRKALEEKLNAQMKEWNAQMKEWNAQIALLKAAFHDAAAKLNLTR